MFDIRSLRQYSNLRLKDLADQAGVSQSDLSKCERGLILPDDNFFMAIAKRFTVDPDALKKRHEELLNCSVLGEGYATARPNKSQVLYSKEKASQTMLPVWDIFCGTGGFSHGFEQTHHFQVVLGLDLLADRARTFSRNHSKANVIIDNIQNIDIDSLAQIAATPEVIIGGPPCQGFSSIRPFRNLTLNDHRNNLFESFALIVNRYKPKWFVLENVVGLLTHKHGQTLKTIIGLFEQIGYKVDWRILNTAFYGLPQRRERLIIVGNLQKHNFRWPEPTHYFNGRSMAGKEFGQTAINLPLLREERRPSVTVMEAIHDLPELQSGESSSIYRMDIELTEFERLMRGENEVLTLHDATKHSERMLEIIRYSGFNRDALPKGLTTSGFSSSYSRLEPNLPSVTLTVNFVHPSSNKCIHPYQERALTPREGARLQGFEDSYIFTGSRAQIVKQIGNAVPPMLGKLIAQTLLDYL